MSEYGDILAERERQEMEDGGEAVRDDCSYEVLTESERNEIEATREALKDVYGMTKIAPFEHSDAEFTRSRVQLEEALQMLPDDLRDAYDEAMKKAPLLVEKESKPDVFLRVHGYEPWTAARKIALYWQRRKELFGDRAFLPMTITGHGAVSADGIEAIKCGGTCILSPDSSNRPILYADKSKACARCSDAKIRSMTMFYFLQVLLDMESAIRNGYIVVVTIDTSSKQSISNAPNSKVLDLITEVFPIFIRATHIVVFRKRSFIESVVPIWLKFLDRSKFVGRRTLVHYAESSEAIYGDLKQYGIIKDYIPRKLGGTVDYDEEFDDWFEWRLEIETERYAPVRASVATAAAAAAKPTPAEASEDESRGRRKLDVAADQAHREELIGRKRKLDAIYQRRKRQQRKADFGKLTEELKSLREDNNVLKTEQRFLESILEQAKLLERSCDKFLSGTIPGGPVHVATAALPSPSGPSDFGRRLPRVTAACNPCASPGIAEVARGATGMQESADRSLTEQFAFDKAAPGDFSYSSNLYQKVQQDMLLRQRANLHCQQMLKQDIGLNAPADRNIAQLSPQEGHAYSVLSKYQLQKELEKANESALLQSAFLNRIHLPQQIPERQDAFGRVFSSPPTGIDLFAVTGLPANPSINHGSSSSRYYVDEGNQGSASSAHQLVNRQRNGEVSEPSSPVQCFKSSKQTSL